MFKHNFDKVISWTIMVNKFKQSNFIKVQNGNTLKIKSLKPKAKETSLSIMFQDIV
jgi:hypothetical protein